MNKSWIVYRYQCHLFNSHFTFGLRNYLMTDQILIVCYRGSFLLFCSLLRLRTSSEPNTGVILVSMTVKEGTYSITVITFMDALIYPLIIIIPPFSSLFLFFFFWRCCFCPLYHRFNIYLSSQKLTHKTSGSVAQLGHFYEWLDIVSVG